MKYAMRTSSFVQKCTWVLLTGFYPKLKNPSQSTYFIDEFNQGMIKNPKIKEIQQVQQKIYTKQV